MEIITQFLNVAQVLVWITVAAICIAGVVLAGIGLWRGDRRFVLMGALVGLAPLWVPALGNLFLATDRTSRRAEVAAMPREPLPAGYPRQLVVMGDLWRADVEMLMATTDLDQVVVADGGRPVWYTRAVANGCLPGGRRSGWCRSRTGPSFARVRPYLLVRLDRQVTRRAHDRNPAPEAVQIDLIDAREHLILYEEMPVTKAPFSTTKLLPQAPRYPCSNFDTAQVIRNVLDSARQPSAASHLMRRTRAGQSDTCVTATLPA